MTDAPDDPVSGARIPVVVMASGTGSLLESLLGYTAHGDAPFEVIGVVVDRDCRAATIAERAGVPVDVVRVADYPDRNAWDVALTELIAGRGPEWIVTAGFMKILGPSFLGRFGGHIVNSHPALLPSFPGAHGVSDALAHGVKVTGVTIHLVDEGVDTGPILAQAPVMVGPDDTEDTLHERIKSVERVLLPDVVAKVATRGVVITGRKARIP